PTAAPQAIPASLPRLQPTEADGFDRLRACSRSRAGQIHRGIRLQFFMNRRDFLSSAGLVVAFHSVATRLPALAAQGNARPSTKADHTLRIEPCTLDIGPGASVKTLAYN